MSAWVCSLCHSINNERHDTCYSCRRGRGDQSSQGQQSNPAYPTWQPSNERSGAAEPTFLYTGVLLRGLAYLVDVVLVSAYWLALFTIPFTRALNGPVLAVLLVGGTVLYFLVGWAEFGTTIGMRLFRLKIVRASDGRPIGYLRALVRIIVFVVSFLLLPGGLLMLPVVLDRRRRALHDHAAGSVVIRPASGRFEYPTPREAGWATANS